MIRILPTLRKRPHPLILPAGFLAAALLFGSVGMFGGAGTAKAADGGPCGLNHCIVSKAPAGFDFANNKALWTVTLYNWTSSPKATTVTDCGSDSFCSTGAAAVLESTSPCTGIDLKDGLVCTVPANGSLAIQVSTLLPAGAVVNGQRCRNTEVANYVTASTSEKVNTDGASQSFQADPNAKCAPSVTPRPAILISKAAGTPVLPAGGGSETYTYTVTNPGNVPLSDVSVSDNTCSPVTFVGGDTNTNNLLDTSETWTFTCTMNITANTTNIATATGTANGTTVSAQAQASVTVQTAQTVVQTLTVTKVVSPASDPGTFNLLIDGTTEASSVGNGGTTGSVQVTAGPHTVSETGVNGTSLSNYVTTFSANCAGGSVNIAAGTAVVCTITNTRNTTETSNPPPNNPPITLITIPQQPAPTPTATPTTRPTEAPQPTATAEPTKTSAVLGEKTPGPGATPAPPSAGSGRYSNWFHSAGALSVIGLFILSAALSGMVLFTTRKRGE